MSGWRFLVLILLSLALGACSARPGSTEPPAGPNGGLPGIDELDRRRAASSGGSLSLNPLQTLDSANASPAGNALSLSAPADAMAWALYRIDPASLPQPDALPLSIQLSGSGSLSLLLADFAAQRWSFAAALEAGQAAGDFSLLSQPLSAQGFAYFAVAVPAGASGQIEGLELSYSVPSGTFYVAPPQQGGDDANPGSAEQPWATLQFAADQAAPGALIIVRPGSYEAFKIRNGGQPAAPVIFRSEPGAAITEPQEGHIAGIEISDASVICEYVHVEGFEVLSAGDVGIYVAAVALEAEPRRGIVLRGNRCGGLGSTGIWLRSTAGALLEDNHCLDCGQAGIAVGEARQGLTLRGNICDGNGESGIVFDGGSAESGTAVLVEGNICSNNGVSDSNSGGLYIRDLRQSIIRNNLLYRNGQGILLSSEGGSEASGNLIVNNTVFQDADGGNCVQLRSGSSGNLLFNNILLHDTNAAPALEIDNISLPGFQSDYNIVSNLIVTEEQGELTLAQWQALGLRDEHSRLGNSFNLFISTVEDNYRLAMGALALESALADFAPLADIEGTSRPQGAVPDIGCYEKAGP